MNPPCDQASGLHKQQLSAAQNTFEFISGVSNIFKIVYIKLELKKYKMKKIKIKSQIKFFD